MKPAPSLTQQAGFIGSVPPSSGDLWPLDAFETTRPRGSVTWYGAAPKNGSGCASNHVPHLTTYGRAAPEHDGGGYYDHGSNAQQTTPR